MGRPHRHYENRILKSYFNTARRLQEVQSMGGCDGHGRGFAIELFQRDVPTYVREELEQALEDDADGTLLPVVVWHEKGKPYDEDLVLMPQWAFQDLLNEAGR